MKTCAACILWVSDYCGPTSGWAACISLAQCSSLIPTENCMSYWSRHVRRTSCQNCTNALEKVANMSASLSPPICECMTLKPSFYILIRQLPVFIQLTTILPHFKLTKVPYKLDRPEESRSWRHQQGSYVTVRRGQVSDTVEPVERTLRGGTVQLVCEPRRCHEAWNSSVVQTAASRLSAPQQWCPHSLHTTQTISSSSSGFILAHSRNG